MKIKFIILKFCILGIVIISCDCKENNPQPVSITGGLIIKVKLDGLNDYKSGVKVGLATSLENLDNSIYLQIKKTSAIGNVNMGQLNPGNYYCDGYYEIDNNLYYGISEIQVVAGTNKEITLVIE